MRNLFKPLCLLLILLVSDRLWAQNCNDCDVDSLYKQVSLKKTDTEKVKVLEQVILNYRGIGLKIDTIIGQLIALNTKTKTVDPAPYIAYREAISLIQKQETQLALDKYKVAITGFDKDKKEIENLLSMVRLLYNVLNKQEERYQFYHEKLNYYLINGPVKNTAACYHGLGGYYVYKGNYDLAISNYLKAAEVYKTFSYGRYINDLQVVGVQYAAWGNFEKASYYLSKSLPYLRTHSSTLGATTFALMALSNINLKHKNYQKALAYADEAIKDLSAKPANRDYAMATLQKGFIYLSLHKATMAYPYLVRAKSVSDTVAGGDKLLNQNGALETDFAWHLYYKEIGKQPEAEASLLAAYKKAVDERSNDDQLKYLKELSQWFAAKKSSSEAKLYFEKYFTLNDSMQSEQGSAKIARYENEQKEHQQAENINNLRQERAVQAAVINKSHIITIVSLVALLLISGALFFIYRQLQINKKILVTLQKTQTQLIQSEKMASLGELTAGIAHEIQNPLNFVNNFSEVNAELIDEMQEEIDKGDFEEVKAIANDIKENQLKINHHGKRADFIVKGMLQHSRTSSGERQLTNINVLADEFLKLSYHGLRAKDKNFNAELITNFDETLPKLNIVQQDIGRVLLNLFNNAFYAVNEKKKTAGADYAPQVTITTFAPPSGGWGASVRDNGIGIPDAIKDKIMQPFFTTKPTGEGTGLGLSLSYDIVVKGHDGSISVDTKEDEFTEFTVALPLK
ncbi:MAG: ATP-binding protein [Bacteroidota bacterium]